MSVLPDHWILDRVRSYQMIEPFAQKSSGARKISYGLSSYGYDFRLSDEYRIPKLKELAHLDPKQGDQVPFDDFCGPFCLVPRRGFLLARSLEFFRIPRDVLVLCQGKSTYARSGLVVNVTPLEPEWEGFITIALMNSSEVPIKVYSGEGIAQAVFIRSEAECNTSYADKKGKYQNQKEIRHSQV